MIENDWRKAYLSDGLMSLSTGRPQSHAKIRVFDPDELIVFSAEYFPEVPGAKIVVKREGANLPNRRVIARVIPYARDDGRKVDNRPNKMNKGWPRDLVMVVDADDPRVIPYARGRREG